MPGDGVWRMKVKCQRWETRGTRCLRPDGVLEAEPEKGGLIAKRKRGWGLSPQPCREEASGECSQQSCEARSTLTQVIL